MKMNHNDLFPPVESSPKFKQALKEQILDVYAQRQKPEFTLGWLVAPGVVLVSILLVFIMDSNSQSLNGPSISIQSQPASLEIDSATKQAEKINKNESIMQGDLPGQLVKPADSTQEFSEIENTLGELSYELVTDGDLELAIAFSNL